MQLLRNADLLRATGSVSSRSCIGAKETFVSAVGSEIHIKWFNQVWRVIAVMSIANQ